MAESRSKRMQVVLLLTERSEQQAGRQFSDFKIQVDAEEEQLKQLDEYAKQYLAAYVGRRTQVRPEELIAYSGFIQRLGDARKEQEQRLNRMREQLVRLQHQWQVAHQKCESIKDLIERLRVDEALIIDKRLQKEMDELVGQAYARRQETQ
jgi:flagellar protein FliJ